MVARSVHKRDAEMIISFMLDAFRDHAAIRAEFLSAIGFGCWTSRVET
jgi:GTP cyclohydrolase I